jgi:hypothetical protein
MISFLPSHFSSYIKPISIPMTLKTLITVNVASGQKTVDWSAVRLIYGEYGWKTELTLVLGRINEMSFKQLLTRANSESEGFQSSTMDSYTGFHFVYYLLQNYCDSAGMGTIEAITYVLYPEVIRLESWLQDLLS